MISRSSRIAESSTYRVFRLCALHVDVRPRRVRNAAPVQMRCAPGSSGGGARTGGAGSGGGGAKGFLSDRELREIEEQYAAGITAMQVVEIFLSRGIRFSEATFRKYVQQGLLPRSRRVGRKGKHRGSLGVYPAKTVRRVNSIKRFMKDGYTIEQIQAQFLRYADQLEELEERFEEVFNSLAAELSESRFDDEARGRLQSDIDEVRSDSEVIVERLEEVCRRIGRRDTYRSSGAAGSAEELL